MVLYKCIIIIIIIMSEKNSVHSQIVLVRYRIMLSVFNKHVELLGTLMLSSLL